jgi:hypothetical protein
VVGYTDSSGRTPLNNQLAQKRAETVRLALINELKMPAEKVFALGRGERQPVGDNRNKAGREKNRRAEIYVAEGIETVHRPSPVQAVENQPAIDALLVEARELMRRDQWLAATDKLEMARSLGGEYMSDWHALYGIIGFFKSVPAARVRSYLETALDLDRRNEAARDYLSRLDARENVGSGRVTADMGQSVQRAIAVSTVAQQYEYLTLFGAIPRYHHQLDSRPVDVWECIGPEGRPMAYYFDHSGTFTWALESHGVTGSLIPVRQRPAGVSTDVKPQSANHDTVDQSMAPVKVTATSLVEPRAIWESRLFN